MIWKVLVLYVRLLIVADADLMSSPVAFVRRSTTVSNQARKLWKGHFRAKYNSALFFEAKQPVAYIQYKHS